MLTAMLFPEAERGRGNKDPAKVPESGSFGRERLRQAREVLKHSQAIAKDIIHGITRFDDAVDQVRRQQKANETVEQAIDHQQVGSYAVAARASGSTTASWPFSVNTQEPSFIWWASFSAASWFRALFKSSCSFWPSR